MDGRQLVQQPAFVLPWFDGILFSRQPVDNRDFCTRLPNPIPQFRRQIPLDLLARQGSYALQQRRNSDFCSTFSEKCTAWRDCVTRVPFAHHHLIGAVVGTGRCHRDFVSQSPETQQPDAELTLQTGCASGLQPLFDGIADMGGDIMKIRPAIFAAWHALTIV